MIGKHLCPGVKKSKHISLFLDLSALRSIEQIMLRYVTLKCSVSNGVRKHATAWLHSCPEKVSVIRHGCWSLNNICCTLKAKKSTNLTNLGIAAFSSPKAALLLVSTKNHDRWPVPTPEVLRKSAIHGRPVTLRMLRVKSDKTDWFQSHSIPSPH